MNLESINSNAVSFIMRGNATPLSLTLKDSEVGKAVADFDCYLKAGVPTHGRYTGIFFKNNAEAFYEDVAIDFKEVAAVKSVQRIEK